MTLRSRLRLLGYVLVPSSIALLLAVTFHFELYSEDRLRDLLGALGFFTLVGGLALIAIAAGAAAASDPPRPLRVRVGCAARGLFNRLAWSLALNLVYWMVFFDVQIVFDLVPPPWLVRLAALVDLPVAIAGLGPLLQDLRNGHLDVWMLSVHQPRGTMCFGVPVFLIGEHLATAVPIWMACLYLPTLFRAAAEGVRRRRTSAPEAPIDSP